MALKLKELREASGMTQKEVARAIGGSYRAIQSWESGRTWPDADKVLELAALFEVDPNTILGWYDDHPLPNRAYKLDISEQELIRNYRASGSQWKQNIAMTARAAAGESKEAPKHSVSTPSKKRA